MLLTDSLPPGLIRECKRRVESGVYTMPDAAIALLSVERDMAIEILKRLVATDGQFTGPDHEVKLREEIDKIVGLAKDYLSGEILDPERGAR